MAEQKSPSANFRRTLYWNDDTEVKVTAIAEKLHGKGIKGMYTGKGEVNRMAVIRYLLDKEIAEKD